MESYFFVFGRTPELAALELSSFFPEYSRLSTSIGQIEGIELEPQLIVNELGGTVKIARQVGEITELFPENLVDFFASEAVGNKVTIGISTYDGVKIAPTVLPEIKKLLQARNISCRFVMPTDGTVLSSVVIDKQHVSELILFPVNDMIKVGRTLVVQSYEMWNHRDFDRPANDQKAGMLPVKVARMAVNIALGRESSGRTLLDPFCGMGTIVGEAWLRNSNAIGIDIAENAVVGATKNLEFLASISQISQAKWSISSGDATHASEKVPMESVDVIVTEPFMGPTTLGLVDNLSQDQVKNVLKGLEKLYIGCFRDWQKILKPGGLVLMALPKIYYQGRIYSVKRVIDTCESLGYTTMAGPIEYSRPQAVVKREFYLFKKQ